MSRIKSVLSIATLAVLVAAPLVHAQGGTTSTAPATQPATESTTPPAKPAAATTHHAKGKHAMAYAKVDINSASKDDLMKLPGIGDATADKIIAARPFKTKAELVSKTILTKKQFAAIATKVMAKQEAAAASTTGK